MYKPSNDYYQGFSPFKHKFWMRKRNVSMRRFFDTPRTYVKVTAHTWAIFFPKNRFFSFFDIL